MAPIVLAGLISAAAGLAQTGVNAAVNKAQRNAENAYNDPAAQMQRMIAAGINPNSAAAGIAGTPNLSAQTNAVDVPNMTQGIQDVASADSLIKQAKADVDLKNAQAAYYDSLRTGKDIENEYAPERWQSLIDQAVSTVTKNNADSSYVQEKTRQLQEMFPKQKELLEVNVDKIREEINELKKRQQVEQGQIELMKTEEGLNAAQARKANSDAAINEFIVANGYSPDDPQAELIRKGASGDPKQEKEADELLNTITEVQKEADKAKKENDPIYREKVRLEKAFKADVERIDEEIEYKKSQLHEYKMGRKKDNMFKTGASNLEDEIKWLEQKRNRLEQDYHENIRRIDKNESYNVFGIGQNK